MIDKSLVKGFLQSTAGEWFMIVSLVFGGCCSNVWALEGVLKNHPKSGTFLTFAQFSYVAFQNLSSQLDLAWSKSGVPYPRLKDRKVPLKRWMVQVVLFFAVSLMNNYAFGLKIPVTVHIIFRSGGLCVSMLVGRFVGKRRYSIGQVLAGMLITIGIVMATLSAPHRKPSPPPPSDDTVKINDAATSSSASWLSGEREYAAGIGLLAAALVLSALLGLYQESTYRQYGRQWKEALFYGHFLSLPFFLPFTSDLLSTYSSYASSPPLTLLTLPQPTPAFFPALFTTDPRTLVAPSTSSKYLEWRALIMPSAMFALALNLVTQGLCVRGVNRLTTRVNSVTVNLVLTVRKAVSLGISVWYYGSGFTWGLGLGGGLVLLGTILYSLAPGPKAIPGAAPATTTTPKIRSSPRPAPIDLPEKDNAGANGTAGGLTTGTDPLASAGLRMRQSPVDSR
ncbi:hypothetical protein IAT38_001448 [Cryptococcus sp. DSM 104549]